MRSSISWTSLFFDERGKATFTKDEDLHSGIYIAYLPNQQVIEFIASGSEQMEISSSMDHPIKDLMIKGSKENDIFVPYQKKLGEIGEEMMEARSKMDEAKGRGDETAAKKFQEELREKNSTLNDYRLGIAKKHPKSFLSKVIRAMQDVEVPEHIDSTQRYVYYKEHYFDNMDFHEAGLLYTPVFHNKLHFFFDKLVHPHYDSVIQDVSTVLDKLYTADTDLYRYSLSQLLNKYQSSPMIVHENVFYFIGQE